MRFFRLPSAISRLDLFQRSRENQGFTPLTLKTVSENVTISCQNTPPCKHHPCLYDCDDLPPNSLPV